MFMISDEEKEIADLPIPKSIDENADSLSNLRVAKEYDKNKALVRAGTSGHLGNLQSVTQVPGEIADSEDGGGWNVYGKRKPGNETLGNNTNVLAKNGQRSEKELEPALGSDGSLRQSSSSNEKKYPVSLDQLVDATPVERLILQALRVLGDGLQDIKNELKELRMQLSNDHGEVFERVADMDLAERLRHIDWVKSFSQPMRHSFGLNENERTLLDDTLRKTKYHDLLDLLSDDTRKNLSSDTPSIQTDAMSIITIDMTKVNPELVKFHENKAMNALREELSVDGHLLLLNESTSMLISKNWQIKSRGKPWLQKLERIKNYLATKEEYLTKSLRSFIHKMLQLERSATAWRIKYRLTNGALFPLDNMMLAISSSKRPDGDFVEMIAEAVPTVSKIHKDGKLMFVDNWLEEKDMNLNILYD